jgi:hypothetical protein
VRAVRHKRYGTPSELLLRESRIRLGFEEIVPRIGRSVNSGVFRVVVES